MSAENERFVRVTWEELWRTGNERLIEEYRAPNYVLRNPPTGLTPDCEGLKGVVLAMRRAFPDLRVTTEEVIADGEKVAQHYRFQGTHQGALFGIPPTGRSVNVRQVIVSRVAQRKIVEEWVEINLLGLLQQVGALPAIG